jgi:magnesium transporter
MKPGSTATENNRFPDTIIHDNTGFAMNFGYVFRLPDKTTTTLDASTTASWPVNPENFAWIDLDLNASAELEQWLFKAGLNEQELVDWRSAPDTSWHLHRQKLLMEWIPVCLANAGELAPSPLLICMTDSLIITAHKDPLHCLANTRSACEDSFRSVGRTPGFIYFLIWDNLIDGYMPMYTGVDNRLDDVEEAYLLGHTSETIFQDIIAVKRDIRSIKKSLVPMQRTLRHLVTTKLDLISEESLRYLNRLYENQEQMAVMLESLQERSHSTLEGFNSVLSQQTNHSLKILTIFTTILMPLSLIAGIYGTNFTFVPEFTWKYSYFVFWIVLIVLSLLMVLFLKKKKWL